MIPSITYGLIYTVPFKSIKDNSFLIEIYKRDYTGTSTELIGSDSPFVITIEDADFVYEPLRFSNAKLTLVGNDYLRGLFSVDYQQYKVVLKSDKIIWSGFIKPEIYSQDYTDIDFTLELECISGLSSLEFIDYPQQGVDGKEFISIWNLIKLCIGYAYSDYTGIVLPHVYASNIEAYANKVNVLNEMLISEQNFFDEDGVPMNLKDVLEEICKFLNWTCADWKGKVYFNDPDWTGEYLEYTPDFSSYTVVSPNELNVQANGFAGADHTLDILGGYNKVSVKTNNYNVGEIFPEEEYSKLKSFANPEDKVSWNKVTVKRFYIPGVYKFFQYDKNRNEISESELASYKNNPDEIIGAMPIKRCEYNMVENNGQWNPDITNYNWEELIQVRRGWKRTDGNHDFLLRDKILTFASQLPVAPYANGAIAISCYIQITANDDLSTDSEKREGTPYCECSLSIGDKYYNGVSWVSDSTARFNVNFPMSDISGGSFVQNENTKTLNMPYDGLNGYVVELPRGEPLIGEPKFVMYSLTPPPGNYTNLFAGIGYYIKGLKMSYNIVDGLEDELPESTDRIYENVVNESYVNALDEIENKISTYNYDGLSYSKVLLSGNFLTDNLYSALKAGNVRLEEQLITRIINRYSQPSIKLKQILSLSDNITPITRMTDNYLSGKKFIVTGGSINIEAESFETQMVEVL